jgi:hypothetical protein
MDRRRCGILVVVIACGTAAWAGPGEAPVQSFAVGDFDGDGTLDIAVGLPDVKAGKSPKAGEVRVYSGKTGQFLRAHSGKYEGDRLGVAIAAIGDADGDGATDLAISAPFARPRIEFVSGANGKDLHRFDARAAVGYADRMAPLGDGTGKTRVDIAIRHVKVDEKAKKEVAHWRYVYSDKEAMGCAYSDDGGSATSAQCVGDIDGDGKPDLAIVNVTAPHDGRKGVGQVTVVSGQFLWQGDRDEIVLTVGGEREGERFGASLAAAGDWNGDKKGDLLVGVAADASKQEKAWSVRVLSGAGGSVLWKASGPAGDLATGGVTLVGDADGDGKPDVAVGSPAAKSKAGAVTVVGSKDGAVIWTVRGAANEQLGDELLLASDVDADGVRDVFAVAPGAAVDGKKGNGYVRLLSGKTGATICLVNPLAK